MSDQKCHAPVRWVAITAKVERIDKDYALKFMRDYAPDPRPGWPSGMADGVWLETANGRMYPGMAGEEVVWVFQDHVAAVCA